MARKQINSYFVDVRLSNKSDHRKSLHIDACSRVGAIYQTTLLLKAYKIEDAFAIVVREEAYPVEIRKRKKAIKLKNKKETHKKNNKESIASIKSKLEALKNQLSDSL